MADTVDIPVTSPDWTQISVNDSAGMMTSAAGHTIFIRENDGQPDATVARGHVLSPTNFFRYEVTGTRAIWAKTDEVGEAGIVYLTVDGSP